MKAKFLSRSIAAATLFVFITFSVSAQLKILSGLEGGTYSQFANDIKSISTQPVTIVPSGGSVENLNKIKSEDDVNITFIQYDVLLEEESKNPKIKEVLKIFQPILFIEEIHVVAKKDGGINLFADLAGKKVAIGSSTQGTRVTALAIKEATGVKWEDVDMSSNDAIQALLDGKIDAFFYVGGSPISKLNALGETANVKLIPVKHKSIPFSFVPQRIKAGTYKWQKEDINTFAVITLPIVKVHLGEENKAIKTLYKDVDVNMKKMMEKGHTKWQDGYENYRKAEIQWPLYQFDVQERD